METDPLSCNINMSLARKVQEAVTCKDLYEIAFKHETLHLQRCQARLNSKKLLTPAGLAREEAEGYAQEIRELKELLKKLICKGKLTFVMASSISMPAPVGTLQFNSEGTYPFRINDQEKIGGDGSYWIKVATSGQCTVSGYDATYAQSVSGDAEEDYLQFKFTPKGQATFSSFRITCPAGPLESYGSLVLLSHSEP
jgi:hypothetical protein